MTKIKIKPAYNIRFNFSPSVCISVCLSVCLFVCNIWFSFIMHFKIAWTYKLYKLWKAQ